VFVAPFRTVPEPEKASGFFFNPAMRGGGHTARRVAPASQRGKNNAQGRSDGEIGHDKEDKQQAPDRSDNRQAADEMLLLREGKTLTLSILRRRHEHLRGQPGLQRNGRRFEKGL
jgi:hypothetical protein